MIEIRESNQKDSDLIGWPKEKNNPFECSKFCFTLLEDDVIIAMMGANQVVEGAYRLFLMMNEYGRKRPILFTKAAKIMLAQARSLDPATRRIELTVREDFKSGQDWAEMMGFVKEGFLHDYDPDDSIGHFIYYLPKKNWET